MSESVQSVRDDCSVTDVVCEKKKFAYTWTITNFRILCELGQKFITSYDYPPSEANKDSKLWGIDLYINGHPKSAYGIQYLGMDIHFDTKTVAFFYNYYKFYIYTIDNRKIAHLVNESDQITYDTVIYNVYNVLKRSDLLSDQDYILADGNLILKFELIFTDMSTINNDVDSSNSLSLANSPKLVEFESTLCNKKFSDAKIIVGDKVLPVHKVILATRSPVFAAMFDHEMKESQENSVEIEDFDEETVREMLSFIYTGKVDELGPTKPTKVAYQLLAAANKYQIEQLKRMCEASLVLQLKVDNVIPLLMHAEMYDAEMLKSRALKFFKLHGKEVAMTKNFNEDFEKLFKTLPEIFKALVF